MALTLNGTTGISGIAGSAGTPALQGNNDANTGYFFAADTLGLSTAGSERLRITAAGNLALGNDGSFPIFDNTNDRTIFIGTGSDDAGIQLHSATDRFGGIYFGDATSGTDRYSGYIEYKHSDNYLRFATGSTEKVRITSAGQLVIGATTSRAKFEIKDNGYTETAVIQRISTDDASPYALVIANDTCNGTATNGMQFFVNNGGDHYIRCRGSSTAGNNNFLLLAQNDMRFSSGSSETERLRIDSGGDVLVGLTTSPSGNGTNIWVSDGTVARLGIEKTGTGACKTTIGAGSDRAFNIYNETADHEIIRGETNGDLKITTGNLVIGTAGKGIDFSAQTASSATGATTGSETLDHYETGTWTPTDTSGAGLTFTSVNGWYVKVGDLVTMGARFAYPSTTNTNQNKIGGFPFTPGTNVFSVGSMMVGTVQNPMGNQGSWAGIDQLGRLRTENASVPYNDDLSGSTVYLSYSFKTD